MVSFYKTSLRKTVLTAVLLGLNVNAVITQSEPTSPEESVVDYSSIDTDRIKRAAPSEWLSYGRTYSEQRYSPLTQIDHETINRLGLAWSFDTESIRGLEGTPIVVDGLIYVTGNWGIVYALDARTGALVWRFDPEVDRETGALACCDIVNRGVAVYGDAVYVGVLDGRLVALNRQTGRLKWQVDTLAGEQGAYTVTGAPRAADGKVFIGNGGAEYGVRGFVSAYDANTGDRLWRFYTVPGDPQKGFENEAMAMAAKTWSGSWWQYGGGGTVWDSIVYDDELNQLLIGVGNGSPWNRRERSPDGGDNLFLSSIVALNPDSGEYLWHYQETPGETWDYTATQQIMLADMEIGGDVKKVLWHAPKNGFFFVIDRVTGSLISADPFVKVTWASGYDLETGRPIETPNADFAAGPQWVSPSPMGGHNWQPMAYSPRTNLVYIPITETALQYKEEKRFKFKPGHWNTGVDLDPGALANNLLNEAVTNRFGSAALLAWDPLTQKPKWRVPMEFIWNGGVLATAGDLIFQPNSSAELVAYDAHTGKALWSYDIQERSVGTPVSYELDGEQYIAVLAGWGGAISLSGGGMVQPSPEFGRVLAFKLGGDARLPALAPLPDYGRPPEPSVTDASIIERGRNLYTLNCMRCHGSNAVSNGRIPDLRRLPPAWYDQWDAIVLDGIMAKAGMVGFADVLTAEDSLAIKSFVLTEAQEDYALRTQPRWWVSLKTWFYDKVAAILVKLMEFTQ
ncbi:MAG: hypothetical protein RI942_1333 [Pseudomonadota bacterium]